MSRPVPSGRPVVTQRCPCGTGVALAECCGRLLDGMAPAGTAEQLMRSRYSAFAVGNNAYLLATWHSTTRPSALSLDRRVRWTGLDVLSTSHGSLLSSEGTVEFRAHYARDRAVGAQHEISRFARESGEWRYLDGLSLA